jgi:hypothetical protein
MSNRNKGNFYERKAQLELTSEGYRIYRVKGSTKFIKEVDMFNLFDMFALKKIFKEDNDSFHIERRYIQIKTNKKLGPKELVPYNEFKENYCGAHDSVEVWSFWQQGKRKKKKGWEVNIV